MLRKALQRAQQKVHDCDIAQSIDGGQEVPGVVRANAKASAAWGVLMSRIETHNSTSKFLERMDSSSAALCYSPSSNLRVQPCYCPTLNIVLLSLLDNTAHSK